MRDFLPLPDTDIKKIMLVDLKPGESVKEHQHEEPVILYYPHDSTEPLKVYPRAGMLIYIPPETVHEVPSVEQPRQSIATVFHEIRQKG